MGKFENLLAPGKIGVLAVANRVFMPAMVTGLASYEGEVTAELLNYYAARAKSGPGVIVAEITCVEAPRGKAVLNQLRIDHPRYLTGLSRLAETIKIGGSRAFIQLHHAGRQTSLLYTEGQTPLSPSGIPCRASRVMPQEMTLDDIQNLRQKYVEGAVRAYRAGFDGVELHAAHGYLLSQFISPYTNRREDRYGGNTAARVRLLVEIIRDVKLLCPDLVVGVRFNVTDFLPGGIEPEEGVEVAQFLEKAGADYLSTSCGMHESGLTTVEPKSYPEGWRVYLSQMVKEKVAIPVVGGGVIRSPEMANELIARGRMDYVFIGRGQIADEQWVAKVRAEKTGEIRPCLSCNTCIGRSFKDLPIACTVNPGVGREGRLGPLIPASNPLCVLVVGGGPAGMAAATGLARRGYQVTLIDSGHELGGALRIAAKPPHKERLEELRKFLINQLTKVPVEVRLRCSYDARLLAELLPEVVVVATGAVPKSPSGFSGDGMVVQAVELLAREHPGTGKRVLVAGGGVTGCETALYLAACQNQVVLVEYSGKLATDLDKMSRRDLLASLEKAQVEVITGHTLKYVDPGHAVIEDDSGKQESLRVDQVVLALGAERYDPVTETARLLVPRIYIIGDAARPRNIEAALYEAEILVRLLG